MPGTISEKEMILLVVRGDCMQAFEEQRNQGRIKQDAGLPDQKIIYAFLTPRGTIWPVRRKGIPNIHDGENTCRKRNFLLS